MKQEYETYYVPAQSRWPIVGAFGMFFIAVGAASTVINSTKEEPTGLTHYFMPEYFRFLGLEGQVTMR